MKQFARKVVSIVTILVFVTLFSACGEFTDTGNTPVTGGLSGSDGKNSNRDKYISYEEAAALPAVDLPVEPEASGADVIYDDNGSCSVDISNISSGYFMANYTGEPMPAFNDIKVTVVAPLHGQYVYDLRQDGEYESFPFSDGDGTYLIRINRRLEGSEFVVLLTVEVTVQLESEFAPYLVSTKFVNYTGDSVAVKFASNIDSDAADVFEQVEAVYNFIIKNVVYDTGKAEETLAGKMTGYVPDVDKTLKELDGICFDYAALAAAMLRSYGIPTKMVHGIVPSAAANHAWIMVYTEETGWVGAIEFSGQEWIRMDPTFAAGGDSPALREFIGDGQNYTDTFWY